MSEKENKKKSGEENVMIDVNSLDLKSKVSIREEGVDLEALEKAESIISNMTESYIEWAKDDIKRLSDAYEGLVADLDNYQPHLREIFEISHDMKGQGGSFNYTLMTGIGNYLCRFVERIKDRPTPKILEVIKLHIDAMRMVIFRKIVGDGGQQGAAIIAGLEKTLIKYIPETVRNSQKATSSLPSGDI